MINKLRITTKFLLLSFVSISALISISVYGLYNSHSTFQWVEQVYETASVIDDVTKKIGLTIYELRELSQALVMAPNKRLQRELSQKQITVIENLDNNLIAWERTLVQEKEQQMFQKLMIAWQQYKKLVNLTREHAMEGYREAAFINVSGPEEQQFQTLLQQFSHWLAEEVKNAASVYTEANQHYATARLIYIVLVIAFTLLVIISYRLVAYGMTIPLLQVHKHLKMMAQGELTEEELQYQGADEIADTILSLQQLKVGLRNTVEQANAIAAGNYNLEITVLSQQGQVGRALSEMTHKLRAATVKNTQQDWLKSGQTQLSSRLSGEQQIVQLAENIINFLTPYLDAQVGAFYLLEEGPETRLKMIATYAYTWRKHVTHEFKLGDGVVGQAALERKTIVITEPPAEYIYIQTGLGGSSPRAILVMPFLYEGELKGVIELAAVQVFTTLQLEFLNQVMPMIAIAVNTAASRTKMQELLLQTQTQTEELQSQAEELQTQQEELRQTNEELEERSRELERQKEQIYDKNQALEKAKQLVENKAQELEIASKYKSEFLANMSHELRTPLNSLLILAQLLAENKTGNLDSKQIEFARTIHSAGADLLALINDILDLSKVEAGKMEIHLEEVRLTELLENLEAKFRPVAESKHLDFQLTVADNLPTALYTDVQRLKQILNNLLSNAFKFTAQGEVKLELKRAEAGVQNLSATNCVAISVTDTGIGIPADKQQIIFEPFQQVDGSTSRRYGGTGLGLSISRQLARLLGGEIKLASQAGQGSTFTLYLPDRLSKTVTVAKTVLPSATVGVESARSNAPANMVKPAKLESASEPAGLEPSSGNAAQELTDDRSTLQPGDQVLLIIEDDRNFSKVLLDLARERNFKCVVAEDGKSGLQLAEELKPTAILLDVNLPQSDGWSVMESLKDNSNTRHIPVHFMSASDCSHDAKKMGAIGYLLKPVNLEDISAAFKKIEQFVAKRVKNLLVVIDNQARQQQIQTLVGEEEINTTFALTLTDAYQQLQTVRFDCIIVDADVDNHTGINLLVQMSQQDEVSQIPVILYADRELTPDEDKILQHYEANLTVKAVRSPERLVDEVTLFLHQLETSLSKEKRKMLQMLHDKEAILAHKKVMIVDDDARNTFALATVLEDKNMEILIAENGREALEMLDKHNDVNIVLIDIMMPEMNGYEAMQKIRAQERFRKLPLIALTAKAMKGDKAKCIEAGANDYLTKPVDTNKLLSLMKVWLYR